MKRRSLRMRLLWVHVLTVLVGVGLLISAGNVLIARTISGDDHQRLTERVNAEVAALSIEGGRVQVRDTLNDRSLDTDAWVFTRGRFIEGSPLASPAVLSAVRRLVADPDPAASRQVGTLLLGVREVSSPAGGGARVVAGIDVSDLIRLQRRILLGSVVLGSILILIGALVVRRVLRTALATVDQMTRAAAEWEAHDLDRRFHLGPPQDEFTALAATLDRLLGRVAATRRSELRLIEEVGHELRTPLSAIRATAELSIGSGVPTADRALQEIVEHSDRLSATIAALVAHARDDLDPPDGGVDLTTVVQPFAEVAEITSEPALPHVEGDPRILRQLLTPIVENARRHAASRVWIEVVHGAADTVQIRVRDDGPGVDPGLGVKVFIPGTRGTAEPEGGSGLGLSVAQRLAGACGGNVQLGEGPGGCFVVILRRVARTPAHDA